MSETKAVPRSEPSAPPLLREDLIQTAVKFLIHPNVVPRPLEQKKSFLSSKGLTDEETQEAISRALAKTPPQAPAPVQPPPHVSVPVPYTQFPVSPYVGPFERLRRILQTLVLLGGLGYGIYWLYKTYIEPFLFGKKKPEIKPVEDRISNLEQTVKTGLAEIRIELGQLGKSTSESTRTHDKLATFHQMKDIQENLSSVKGLLLSRQQFPPAPVKSTVSIPSWQLSGTVADGTSQTESSSSLDSKKEDVKPPSCD